MDFLQNIFFSLLILCGLFTAVLGFTHFIYPRLFHYHLIVYTPENQQRQLAPFRLWFITYPLTLDSLYAIIWMMNHHVSFVLVSIALTELFATRWLLAEAPYLLLWFAAWWALRASLQLTLGRRWYDWFWLTVFTSLSLFHLGVGIITLR